MGSDFDCDKCDNVAVDVDLVIGLLCVGCATKWAVMIGEVEIKQLCGTVEDTD